MKITFDIENKKQIEKLLSRKDLVVSIDSEDRPNGVNITIAFFQMLKNGEQTLLDCTNLVIKPEGESLYGN